MSRVAIYARVSTGEQTTANQLAVLQEWAARAGHQIATVFEDQGISGAKGRDRRPAFDRMLKAAVRREFDVIAVWSTDRLGRSMPDLIEVLQTVRSTGVDLYIHTQALDTSTPAGRMLFQMLGIVGEFERELIVARTRAGLARARSAGKTLGRPTLPAATLEAIKTALLAGESVRAAASKASASVGAVASVRKALLESGQLAA